MTKKPPTENKITELRCKQRLVALRNEFEMQPYRIGTVHFEFRYIYRPYMSSQDGVVKTAMSFIMTKGTSSVHLQNAMPHFLKILKNLLLAEEILEFRNRAFWIIGDGYEICIIVEGFGKNSTWVGFCESDGTIKVEFLHRMSMIRAHRRIQFYFRGYRNRGWHVEDTDMMKYLTTPELISLFPNPADRFVYLVKQKSKNNLSNEFDVIVDSPPVVAELPSQDSDKEFFDSIIKQLTETGFKENLCLRPAPKTEEHENKRDSRSLFQKLIFWKRD